MQRLLAIPRQIITQFETIKRYKIYKYINRLYLELNIIFEFSDHFNIAMISNYAMNYLIIYESSSVLVFRIEFHSRIQRSLQLGDDRNYQIFYKDIYENRSYPSNMASLIRYADSITFIYYQYCLKEYTLHR